MRLPKTLARGWALSNRIIIFGNASDYFQELNEIAVDAGYGVLDYFRPEDIAGREELFELPFLIAAGDKTIRKTIYEHSVAMGLQPLGSLVHPSTSVSSSALIGVGTHINRLVAIASGAMIGLNCLINRSCSIGHDVKIGDHVSFGPGAIISGNVEIESEVLIGSGAIVLPGMVIGKGSIIGAGAVVTEDVWQYTKIVGNPGRPI